MAAMIRATLARLVIVYGCCLPFNATAEPASIEGAWASTRDVCDKVFVKGRDGISLTKDADMYGSGFVIDGNRIRGKMANCSIKMRKQDGNTVHLIAACSTDIAVETLQFTIDIVDNNKITRVYPGIPELSTPYERCPM
jgi:hypothetical protein